MINFFQTFDIFKKKIKKNFNFRNFEGIRLDTQLYNPGLTPLCFRGPGSPARDHVQNVSLKMIFLNGISF